MRRDSREGLCPGYRILLMMLITLGGCTRPERDRLVIATPWSASERSAIEADYHQAVPTAGPIAWVALFPGDDPRRLVPDLGADLVLGLPEADLNRLQNDERLDGPWSVMRRSTLGIAIRSDLQESALEARALSGRVALDDPRLDPVALGWAKAQLKTKGYGAVVRTAANVASVGRAGSSLASVLRGEASASPAVGIEGAIDPQSKLVKLERAPLWLEGVAMLRGTRRADEAQAFVTFLRDRGQANLREDPLPGSDQIEADRLLIDLLGATLVDAHDELRDAVIALDDAGTPAELDAYLDDPPPWPPTSVAKLRVNDDGQSMVATLAREISDDPDVRFWLLSTWDRPVSKIDAAWLREVSAAVEGRLIREPRFRAWLRGEWTAWARQHYRRIAREAGKVVR